MDTKQKTLLFLLNLILFYTSIVKSETVKKQKHKCSPVRQRPQTAAEIEVREQGNKETSETCALTIFIDP